VPHAPQSLATQPSRPTSVLSDPSLASFFSRVTANDSQVSAMFKSICRFRVSYDLPPRFRTTDNVRLAPDEEGRCVSRGSRTSRSWRSSERRTGTRFRRLPSEQSIYTWKKRFGVLQPDDVRRLKQFEQENARLKNQ
jgi:hypothetical protein